MGKLPTSNYISTHSLHIGKLPILKHISTHPSIFKSKLFTVFEFIYLLILPFITFREGSINFWTYYKSREHFNILNDRNTWICQIALITPKSYLKFILIINTLLLFNLHLLPLMIPTFVYFLNLNNHLIYPKVHLCSDVNI